jgi:putative nucleotidyltransferase with HDIG domain
MNNFEEELARVDWFDQLNQHTKVLQAQVLSLIRDLSGTGKKLSKNVRQELLEVTKVLNSLQVAVGDVNEQLHSLKALADIGHVVNSSLDLTTVLNRVMDTIIQLTGGERIFLMLKDPQGELEMMVARNWEREAINPNEHEFSRTVVSRVVERGEAVLTTNAQADPRFERTVSVILHSLRSILCVPLEVKDQLIGVIYVDNRIREGQFNEGHRTILSAFANQAAVALENARLFGELSVSYDQTLEALITALEVRDRETEGHTQRVTLFTLEIAKKLGMSDEALLDIRRGGLMHDIGKIGVPDSILLKPGKLTQEEWDVMRGHADAGLRMLNEIRFLEGAGDIIGSHHEHYDGQGYPRGLVGEKIPLGARIFAVADAFDAITSDRPYREAQSYEFAKHEILRCKGKQFDPSVVEAFLSITEEEWEALRSLII